MVEITDKPLSLDYVISNTKTEGSACIVTYIGLIRQSNCEKPAGELETKDPGKNIRKELESIASKAKNLWRLNDVTILHRVGKLNAGDINLIVAIAAGNRSEASEAFSFVAETIQAKCPAEETEFYSA